MNLNLAYQKLITIKQECEGSNDKSKHSSSLDKNSFDFHRKTMHIAIKEIRKVDIVTVYLHSCSYSMKRVNFL